MALINCEECGKQISDKAKACPHCGCPIEQKMVAIRIEREYNVLNGSAINVLVYCDGQLIGPIGNGETINSKIPLGTHTISAAPSGEKTNLKSGSQEIVIDDNCTSVEMSFRISMGAFSGYINFTRCDIKRKTKNSYSNTKTFVANENPDEQNTVTHDNIPVSTEETNEIIQPVSKEQVFEQTELSRKQWLSKKTLLIIGGIIGAVLIICLILSIANKTKNKNIMYSSIYKQLYSTVSDEFKDQTVNASYNEKTNTVEFQINNYTAYTYSETSSAFQDVKNSSSYKRACDGMAELSKAEKDAFSRAGYRVNVSVSYYENGILLIYCINGQAKDINT